MPTLDALADLLDTALGVALALAAAFSALASVLNRLTPHHSECQRWAARLLRWVDRLSWVASRGAALRAKAPGTLTPAPDCAQDGRSGGAGPPAPPPAVLAVAALAFGLAGCGAWAAAARSTSDRWAADVAAVSAPAGRDAAIAWARSLSRRLLDRACAEDLTSGTLLPHPDCAEHWREAGLRAPASRPAE